ncbi:helix-turn-helix domain-containing protein [Halostreptopolyspora alba]
MMERGNALWQRFGTELKRQRELSGVSQAQLAKATGWSPSMISALQQGTRTPKRDHAEALDTALNTGGLLTRLWQELVNQRDVPEWFRDAVLIERRATEIREYEPLVVPGLLQTTEYARAMLEGRYNRHLSDQIRQMAEARAARLPAIQGHRPLLWFVVREAVLKRAVGTETIMKDQLGHIIELAEAGTVQFQVLPDTPVSPGFCLPFRVSSLGPIQSVVYVEHALGGETSDNPEQVSEMTTLFGALQAAAVAPGESIDLVKRWRGEP